MLNLPLHTAAKVRGAGIMVIGASAGGFNLIFDLVLSLPATFPVPVIVIIHRNRRYQSAIEELLDQKAAVRVKMAAEKDTLNPGCVYFAPPDYHLLIEPDGTLSLDYSEPVWYCRPSIDVTFESASDVYARNAIGILLSGANEDGAEGLAYIENNHGLVIAQDPVDAEVKTMPQAAINKCRRCMVLSNEHLFQFVNQVALLHVK
ncbi:chemotaxis protein CheB [Hufsiella ginkgonis]|uniref:protein-glutamate methylesterase n=1 Tax=Hufsiella ginkgonis TaxID=2695274 RepID=A0A7K1XX52_9SPHI|nr:chemotaxis protein CheB [Hufsiella ginkgonis]MXV15096.1 chemotaxis protein CheB [Hufsiella ginkgonis]